MGVDFARAILFLGILLGIVAGAVWLEFFLSKKQSKWLGWILPITTFSISLLYCLNIMDTGDVWQNVMLVISTLLLTNIPTAILLAIYIACRYKRKSKAQLEKMNIKDLE